MNKREVIILPPAWEAQIGRVMADPDPQGEDALLRSMLNGREVLYVGEIGATQGTRITRTSPETFYSLGTPSGALASIRAVKRRLGARDLFDGIPARSLGMFR